MFGRSMNAKRTMLLLGMIAGAAIAVALYVAFDPRPYYRYGNGRVWLENNPNAVWSGLLSSPVFQFRVPLFAGARNWKPTAEQVREALRPSTNLQLSEEEISLIIRSCVSCEEPARRRSEPDGAVNCSQPIRAETNRTPSAGGSRR